MRLTTTTFLEGSFTLKPDFGLAEVCSSFLEDAFLAATFLSGLAIFPRIPFTNAPDSSEPKHFASSTASLMANSYRHFLFLIFKLIHSQTKNCQINTVHTACLHPILMLFSFSSSSSVWFIMFIYLRLIICPGRSLPDSQYQSKYKASLLFPFLSVY